MSGLDDSAALPSRYHKILLKQIEYQNMPTGNKKRMTAHPLFIQAKTVRYRLASVVK